MELNIEQLLAFEARLSEYALVIAIELCRSRTFNSFIKNNYTVVRNDGMLSIIKQKRVCIHYGQLDNVTCRNVAWNTIQLKLSIILFRHYERRIRNDWEYNDYELKI